MSSSAQNQNLPAYIQEMKTSVRKARDSAFLGKYVDSIKTYRGCMENIAKNIQKSADDHLLQSEWQKFEETIRSELDCVQSMLDMIQGKKSNPSQGENSKNKKMGSPETHINQGVATPSNNQRMVKRENSLDNEGYQKNLHKKERDSEQNYHHNPLLDNQGQAMPFNKVPFGHHELPDELKERWANEIKNFRSGEPGQMGYGDEPDFFQKPQPGAYNRNGAYPGANYNGAPYKDPDVWDPPEPKKELKKPAPRKAPSNGGGGGNIINRAAEARGSNKGTPACKNSPMPAGNGAGNRARNYDKPWTANVKKPEDKPKTGPEASKYLYSVYPDGKGPDSELIISMEKDVVNLTPNVNMDDIAELTRAKELLTEAVLLPLMLPDYFTGLRRPWKGVMLFGPPGTGKTMLAKAVATAGGTTFFNVSASTLASKWKGDSEKMVRILFEMARFYAPSVIFFDEIDSIASARSSNEGEASRKVKSELLTQIDGVGTALQNDKPPGEGQRLKTVTVLGATNRPWDLDEAIRRRLEKRIYIPLPSEEGRRQLFEINVRGERLEEGIDWEKLIKATEGYSGADISNLCRDAAFMTLRKKNMAMIMKNIGGKINELGNDLKAPITMNDFEEALKNVNKSVSKNDLADFEKWQKEYASV